MSTTPTTPPAEERPLAERVRATVVTGQRPGRPGPVSAALTFGWRGMLKIKHVPEQLLDVTVTPVMFLVMFTYLFGGAVAGSTGDYLQFLLPGVLVQSVLFTAVYSGVTLNTDVQKGVTDRFRSLPIPRSAPLLGALLGDGVRYALVGLVTVLVGLIMGFRPDEGVTGVVLAILLVVVFAVALSWIFTTLGLLLRTPNAVLNAGFLGVFPLLFISNIFVDPSTLPNWLEAFVDVNPITHLVTASRELMDGGASWGGVGLVLAEAAVIAAVFAPLTVRLYRRA